MADLNAYDRNNMESDRSKERFGEFFFDWWADLWLVDNIQNADSLQSALHEMFPYRIVSNIPERTIDSVAECMTEPWTCYYTNNQIYSFFSSEEDRVKFILYIE